MVKAFASNSFFELLKTHSRERIQKLCEMVCLAYMDIQARDPPVVAEPWHELLNKANARIYDISLGFVSMLSIWPGHLNSEVQHASKLFQYKGTLGEEMLLRDSLNSSTRWKQTWSEVLAKGTASTVAAPRLRDLINTMKCEDARESEAATMEVLEKLPQWRKDLRASMVDRVAGQFTVAMLEKGKDVLKILESDADLPAWLTSSFLDKVVKGLGLCVSGNVAVQLATKLKKLQAKAIRKLLAADVRALVEAFPTARVEDMEAEAKMMESLPTTQHVEKVIKQGEISKMLQEEGSKLSFDHVIYWLWRRILTAFQDGFAVLLSGGPKALKLLTSNQQLA